ncbi:BTAD domain-containing putative transcriptional regulator [Micromonospora sp. WMMD1128]|uniref:AfsR/SARP family transcriptional regulator n=1 Tax=Micromonospora sp. WMMD1128 TaxID=3015150 RepID=UPI00248B38CE|nr:BTAD domain-containing putative transcriptional regulator [Micromonospora sp. WMMD1128]WBB75821.1 BTAD domain-containing putative transcriptional regulator [Micromonospora sp. WMMD1128]
MTAAVVRLKILGPLQVSRGVTPVDLGPTKQKAVFAALALQPGRGVAASELQEAVWGERVPARSRELLHTYIARLRQLLEPETPPRARTNVIVSTPTGYALRIEPRAVDLCVFRELVERARQRLAEGHTHRALRLLRHALHLWRDPALSELTVLLRQSVEVEALRLSWSDAARDYVALGLRVGRPGEVRDLAAQLATREPLDEQVQAHYLTVLERTGQRSLALGRFAAVRDALHRELGVEPGPALQAVHRRLVEPHWAPPAQVGSCAGVSVAPAEVAQWPGELLHRDEDVRALTSLMRAHRLVTVVGPPGCGKSALARAVVDELRDRFADGVVTVDVTGVADRAHLRARMIDLLAGPPSDPSRCGLRQMLVVLDNAEHLVDACALLADTLLRDQNRLTVLVTSREPLNLPHEAIRRLWPLALPDGDTDAGAPAVDLFARYAARVHTGFRVGADNVGLVAQICRRADGLPLVLGYAAAHLADDSLAGVSRRFDGPLTWFRPPGEESRPSLRALLDRSVRTLTPAERWLFARLGALPPVFDLTEAVRLAEPYLRPAEVARVLARLREKSLLQPERGAPSRHRCLALVRRLSTELLAEETTGAQLA